MLQTILVHSELSEMHIFQGGQHRESRDDRDEGMIRPRIVVN